MFAFLHRRPGAVVVGLLLLTQLGVLWLSLDGFMQISVFCTVSASAVPGLLFGSLHMVFLALLPLGLLSLAAVKLRMPYILILVAALSVLPVQASFVHRGVIACDAP